MTWSDYVQQHAGHDVNRVVAAKVGITEPSAARWKTGAIKTPDAVQAAAFARAYNRPVLEAFVAAGFLTELEARVRPAAAPSLDSLSNEELADAVRARLVGEAHAVPDAARTPGRPAGNPAVRQADLDAEAGDPEGPEEGA